MLSGAELDPLKQHFRKLRDEMQYMSAETLPGGEEAENAVAQVVRSLLEQVSVLEQANAVTSVVAEMQRGLDVLRAALKQRNERMMMLR